MANRILNRLVGDDKKSADEKTSINTLAKDVLEEHLTPIHKELTEAGQFSYAALCATVLHTLFDANDKTFKNEALSLILASIEQPQQVCESAQALLEGQGGDDVDPYTDILLTEDALKDGAEAVISQLMAIAVAQGSYDARMRVFIKQMAWRLKVNLDTVIALEASMAETLALSQYEMSEEEKIEKEKKAKRRKFKRYALIGLATIGGGTLIGLTGGLAAPLVAAGAGVIIGGSAAAVLGSTAGVAIIGSLFGVAGAGLTGYKMKKRVGAVEEFRFEPLMGGSGLRVNSLTKQLHITIAVTGWLSDKQRDFKQPWENLYESKEQYALCWETKYLVQMGEALSYIFNSAMTMAAKEALKFTVLRGLLAAVAWPSTLVAVAGVIDNPWSVALQRSHAAGKMLAEVLLTREQGNRPVTLIGFSLGARVIFSCLEELSKRKGSEGIVEDAILLGAPAPGDPKVWATFARVVAGKIVNGYSRGDWLLKFVYRTGSVQLRIAGLRPIAWEDRRMYNVDLSDVVSGHLDYKQQLDEIMRAVMVRVRATDGTEQSHSSSLKGTFLNAAYVGVIDELSSSDDEMYADKIGKMMLGEEAGCKNIEEEIGKKMISEEEAKNKMMSQEEINQSVLGDVGQQSRSLALLPGQEPEQESWSCDSGMISMSESREVCFEQSPDSCRCPTETHAEVTPRQ